ncbi:MAG: preprotein translocase subunit YajC [Actinomycetota bacterium]|nr:preprotein translocase subunit YajC [Actinomycetota bacterium]
MTFLLHPLLVAATSTTVKGKSSSGSSLFTIAFLVLIVGVGYFLIIRPRQARMKQQRAQVSTLDIGSEVMSVGGIMGTIVAVTDTTFDVEVADGVVMTFVKRAINARPASAGGTPTVADDAEGDMPPDPWDEEPEAEDDQETVHGRDFDEHGVDEHGVDEHGVDEHGVDEHGVDEHHDDGHDHPAADHGTADDEAGNGGTGRRDTDGHPGPPDGETGTGSEGSGSGGR